MGIWTGDSKVHELYTVACGLYACWVVLRTAMILYTWIPQGWRAIFNKIAEWSILVSTSQLHVLSVVNYVVGLCEFLNRRSNYNYTVIKVNGCMGEYFCHCHLAVYVKIEIFLSQFYADWSVLAGVLLCSSFDHKF